MQRIRLHILFFGILTLCICLLPQHGAQAADAWTNYGGVGHASANGDSVSFHGHPSSPFVTLLFRPANDGDYRTLTFHLTEGNSDWHTLEGSGFIFNAGIDNNTINGDAVMFGQNSVGFYKLTNVSLYSLQSTYFTACPGVSLVDSVGKPAYSSGKTWYLKLVMSPGSMKFEKYPNADFTGTPEVLFSKTFAVNSNANSGYGPFASFLPHDCSSISTSSFDYFSLTIKPNTPPLVTAPDVVLKRGEMFSPMAGVSATDEEDGNLTGEVQVSSDNVNTQIPGVYQAEYSVADILGATGTCSRKVTVLADALFHAMDKDTGEAIPGLGITVNKNVGALADTDTSGKSPTIWVIPGEYHWHVSKQHEDYLSITDEYSSHIDSDTNEVWPMVIPIPMERKYRDGAAMIELVSVAGKPADRDATARFNQEVEYLVTLTNNSNEAAIITAKLNISEGLVLSGEDTFTTQELFPGELETFPILCKVTSLADVQMVILNACITSLVLVETEATVPDENPENDDASASLAIRNKPIVITKMDVKTKQPLGGVYLQIKSGDTALNFTVLDNGAWVPSKDTSTENNEDQPTGLPTDKDGKLTVYGLQPGEYTLLETKALPGYALPEKPWTFTLNEDAEPTSDLRFTNAPTMLELAKIDPTSGALLDGAVFRIKGADDKIIPVKLQEDGTFKPDEAGNETFTTKGGKARLTYLLIGKLIIEEVTPPIGYASSAPMSIELTSKHTIEAPLRVEVKNKPIVLKIQKVNKANQPITGAGFSLSSGGKALAFFKDNQGFLRYSEKGDVTTIMVDDKGQAFLYGIPEGTYSLTETVVPYGYISAVPQIITLNAKHNSDTPYEIIIVNEPYVKLGMNNDQWVLPVSISLIAAAVIASGYAIYRRKSWAQNKKGVDAI